MSTKFGPELYHALLDEALSQTQEGQSFLPRFMELVMNYKVEEPPAASGPLGVKVQKGDLVRGTMCFFEDRGPKTGKVTLIRRDTVKVVCQDPTYVGVVMWFNRSSLTIMKPKG